MVNIVVIESVDDDRIVNEIVDFLFSKAQCRVMNLPSHFNKIPSSIDFLTFPGLEIKSKEQMVYYDGKLVPMSHHEFFTLLYLAQHPNWVFSKEQIYEAVWKENSEHCGTAVANVISQIRRKIGDGYIKTVIGSGYKFEV